MGEEPLNQNRLGVAPRSEPHRASHHAKHTAEQLEPWKGFIMSERITIKGARRFLAHYARTLAGHGIMPAEEAGRMRLGNPYGQCLYVYTHNLEGHGITHNVPGFCGSSKALGTSPKEAREMIYQAHNTVGDLYRFPAPFDHEAGDAAHRAVMEHYGLWNEYAKIFKVEA